LVRDRTYVIEDVILYNVLVPHNFKAKARDMVGSMLKVDNGHLPLLSSQFLWWKRNDTIQLQSSQYNSFLWQFSGTNTALIFW
jgi:hypothetical protein